MTIESKDVQFQSYNYFLYPGISKIRSELDPASYLFSFSLLMSSQASDVESQMREVRATSETPSKKAAAATAAAIYERQSASSNVVLYVGLGMVSIGLIITFVGVGEKGFSASELKMVGPSLIGNPRTILSC
jgi:hypothetical protein